MKFTEYTLKDGRTYTGYPLNTVGSLVMLLSLQEDHLEHASFSKSALEHINEIRDITNTEKELVEHYIFFSNESGSIETQISELQRAKEKAEKGRSAQLVNLYEVASKQLRNETDVLTVRAFENALSESGYKNMFIMQRLGIIVLGDNEEILYQDVSGKCTALIEKQAENVVTLLNQSPLNRELANVELHKLAKEAIHETIKHDYEKKTGHQQDKEKTSLNFFEIKEKLNEYGLKTLKEFQEKKLLSIAEDGTMTFKNALNIPLLNAVLKNPRLLIDVLNQPTPELPWLLPIGELLKDIEKQFTQFLK